jgi:type VI secretion system protein VasJ
MLLGTPRYEFPRIATGRYPGRPTARSTHRMITFSKLLNALFGTRTPSELARSSQSQWDAWLQPIIELHPGDVATEAAHVGEDPGYDDGFLAIKEQVAKLSDVNDTLIIDTAERLLKHTAKDARVAVYYVYGRMRRDGARRCG